MGLSSGASGFFEAMLCCMVMSNVLSSALTALYRFMRYKPQEMKLLKEVFLTYIAPVHYNAIRRRRAQQMLQRRISGSLRRQSSQIQMAVAKAQEAEREQARLIAKSNPELANGNTPQLVSSPQPQPVSMQQPVSLI